MAKVNLCYKCKKPFIKLEDGKCPKCKTIITPTGEKPVPCPSCNRHIGRRKKGGLCPHCGVPLLLVREKQGQLNVVKYVAKESLPEAPKNGKTDELILDKVDIQIYKSDDKQWKVFVYAYMERVVCPNCRKLAFKPRIMDGEVEHWCDKCKHITMFEFNVIPRNVYV